MTKVSFNLQIRLLIRSRPFEGGNVGDNPNQEIGGEGGRSEGTIDIY